MALIYCPECGNRVSTHASQCPSCGFPISKMSIAEPSTQTPVESVAPNNYNAEPASSPESYVAATQADHEAGAAVPPLERPAVELPKLKVDGRHLVEKVLQGIILIGATLHLMASFSHFKLLSTGCYWMSESPEYDDVLLSPTLMLIYVALSAMLVVAAIRRNHNVAIVLSVATLIAAIMMRCGVNDVLEIDSDSNSTLLGDMEKGFGKLHIMSICGILMVGVGSVIDRLRCRDNVYYEGLSISVALFFALLVAIPAIYPEWENDHKEAVRHRMDNFSEDYLLYEIALYASIVGIAGAACRRYRVSLMAALLALIAMPITLYTKQSFAPANYFGDGFTTKDLSPTFASIATIVVAVVLVATLIVLLSNDKDARKGDGWVANIPVFTALATIVFSLCSCALGQKGGVYDANYNYSDIYNFDSDVTLYFQIALLATLCLVVCRQHIAAFVASGLTSVLLLVVVSLADKVENETIMWGALVSSGLTLFISGYNAVKCYNSIDNRKDVCLDVIVAVVALLAMSLAIVKLGTSAVNHDLENYLFVLAITLVLTPLSIMLVYSMRRSTLVSICLMCILLICLYVLSDKVFDTRGFNDMVRHSKDRGTIEGMLMLKNWSIVLLVGAVLYDPVKRLITHLKNQHLF